MSIIQESSTKKANFLERHSNIEIPQVKLADSPFTESHAASSKHRSAEDTLLFYQLERFIKGFTLNKAAGQLMIGLSNFKAVMKQMILRRCCYSDDRDRMFWFEAMLTIDQDPFAKLGGSTRYMKHDAILNSRILLRVRTVVGYHMKNDKIKLSEALMMFPEYQELMNSGDFNQGHLTRILEKMCDKYKENCHDETLLKRNEFDTVTYFIHQGQMKIQQKSISKIYEVSRRFFHNDYPILIYRSPLTMRPLQMVAIILNDPATVQFMVYKKDSAEVHSILRSVESFSNLFPFFQQLLIHGDRLEVGKRLLLIMKNYLIIEINNRTREEAVGR